VLLALSTGDRSAITPTQWQLFQRYGLNHLVVISGLHVGLLAGAGFLIGGLVSRRWAHLGAASLALLYSALAGFALPTVRALVMLGSLQLLASAGRTIRASNCLGLALFAIALVDPLATHSAGFWLSFGAVALIFYFRAMQPGLRGWHLTLRLQLVLSLSMGLLASFWFGGAGWIAPLANLVAIPILGLWLAPWCLLGALLVPLSVPAAGLAWSLAAIPVRLLFDLDAILNGAGVELWVNYRPSLAAVLTFTLALLLLLAHRSLPLRWLGPVCLLLLLSLGRQRAPPDTLEAWVLDVGQGLSVVIQAAGRVLVYDTGGGDPAGANMAGYVLLPFLQSRGIGVVDLLVISHGDSDHASGVYSLHRQLSVDRTWYGEEPFVDIPRQRGCRGGMLQSFGALRIEVLHPTGDWASGPGNNRSCVLLVDYQGFRILLPGDIEVDAELELRRLRQDQLHANVLLVPHHGSRSSSSTAFIRAVAPELAVFSRGYRNRFGHPHARVTERYRLMGVATRDTARDGAVRIRARAGELLAVDGWRQVEHFYWH